MKKNALFLTFIILASSMVRMPREHAFKQGRKLGWQYHDVFKGILLIVVKRWSFTDSGSRYGN